MREQNNDFYKSASCVRLLEVVATQPASNPRKGEKTSRCSLGGNIHFLSTWRSCWATQVRPRFAQGYSTATITHILQAAVSRSDANTTLKKVAIKRIPTIGHRHRAKRQFEARGQSIEHVMTGNIRKKTQLHSRRRGIQHLARQKPHKARLSPPPPTPALPASCATRCTAQATQRAHSHEHYTASSATPPLRRSRRPTSAYGAIAIVHLFRLILLAQ